MPESTPGPIDQQRLRAVFLGACDLAGAAQAAFLAESCAGDPALRAAAERLLQQDRGPETEGTDELDATIAQPPPSGAAIATDDLPDRIGPFRLLRLLGEGGMGRVFEAEQDQPRRRVALKVLRASLASDSMRQRFENEAEVLGQLRHPGIAQIYQSGTAPHLGDTIPFLAMELVDGDELLAAVDRPGITVRDKLALFVAVCDAVGHAHQRGIVHRDLKPQNILVQDGQPKVLDFGISRMLATESGFQTRTGALVGTLGYMSPEQLAGDRSNVDARSDVYALGVLLYELLTGQLPLSLRDVPLVQAARLVQERDPAPLSTVDARLRGDVETIVHKCLEKEPQRRYVDADALAADVRRFLGDEPIQARPVTALYQLKKFARRNRTAVVGAIGIVVALAGGIIAATTYALRADRQRDQVLREAYRAGIAAATGAIVSDPLAARDYLEQIDESRRGFEWRRLWAMLDDGTSWTGDAHVITGPEGSSASVLTAVLDGSTVEVRDAWTAEVHARIDVSAPAPQRPRLAPDARYLTVETGGLDQLLVMRVPAHPAAESAPTTAIPLPVHAQRPAGIAWHPDGEQLLVCDDGGHARLCSATAGFAPRALPGPITRAAFTRDGTALWCVHHRQLTRRELPSGRQTAQYRIGQPFAAPAFARDHALFAFGNLRYVDVRDSATGNSLRQLTGFAEAVCAIAFDANGRRIAASDNARQHGSLRVFTLAADAPSRAFPRGNYTSLAFDDARDVLVAANDEGVRLVQLGSGGSRVLRGHTSFLTDVAISPDGTLIASGGWDHTVRVWDAESGAELAAFSVGELEHPVHGIAFARDGRSVLALMPRERPCYEWDLATGVRREHATLDYHRLAHDGARALRASHHSVLGQTSHGGHLFMPADRGLAVHSLHTAAAPRTFPSPTPIATITISRDGRRIATASPTGQIALWRADPEFTALEVIDTWAGARTACYALAFDPTTTRLAVATDRNVIDLWDVTTGERVAGLAGHSGYVHSVAFSPDGTRLVSASGDHTVRVWDTVPLRVRHRDVVRTAARRDGVRPWVDELLGSTDPDGAAAAIRASHRPAAERRAALRVLLQTTLGR